MKSESPGLTIGEIAKKLGELWNNTSSEDKQPYEKKAGKLKEKYENVHTSLTNTNSLLVIDYLEFFPTLQ